MPPPRKLRTIDIAATETYLEELRNQFAHNDIKNRVKTLFEVPVTEWTTNHTTRFNSLDQHITSIMLSAEKKCSKKNHGKYEWSPDLAAAGSELAYWLMLRQSHWKTVNKDILDAYRTRAKLPTHSTLTGTDLNREIKLSRKRLQSIRENAHEHRRSWLESLAMSNDIAKGKDPNRSTTLKQLISREEWRRRYKKCQELMGTNTGAGLREIHVPTDPTKEPSNSVQEWTSVTSPPDIIKHIMTQNNKQFSQAKDTPLADTPLGRTIGHNCDSEVAEQILQGTFEVHHQISEVTQFIEKCKKDPQVQEFT